MYIQTMENVFTDAYIAAALWSTTDDNGDYLDEGDAELSDETREKMKTDALAFLNAHIDLINAMPKGYALDSAGHDLWLTRNGHGVGFWDRDAGYVGDKLTEYAKKLGEYDLYIGDDNLIYGS